VPQPRRILLINRSLGEGGTERQVAVVAQALDPQRFEVHVANMGHEGFRADEIRARGLPLVQFPVTSFLSASTVRQGLRLGRYIRDNQIDLVHSFDVPSNIFAAPYARLARRPVVLTSQRADRSLTAGVRVKLLRVTDRIASGIVVNCEFMRRHLIEDEGVRPDRIRLCYNGIDIEDFRPEPGYHPSEFGSAGATCTIGVICVQRPEKGLMTLLEAFHGVAALQPGLRLVFVGSGPVRADLQRGAISMGIASQVAFVPQTADVQPLYRGIDIFVLPSLSEALSNSLMEAMASGCCPVASSVGGNPELVADGKTGLLFPKQDSAALAACLRQLIENPEKRRQFALAARQRMVDEFSIPISIQRMQQIYSGYLDK
jgi:glycosyltransferase involved in cell wall biosynthesis